MVVACTGQGQREVQSRAELSRAGRRAERSVIVSHLRSLIPDRGPTPAHLGVGLSPLRYLVYCGLSALPPSPVPDCLGLPTPVFSVDWIFCPVPERTTSTRTRTPKRHIGSSCEAASPAQPPACLLHLIFFSLPARWLALLYQEPTSPPPPFCPCSANMRPSHDAQPHKSIISPWILCKV